MNLNLTDTEKDSLMLLVAAEVKKKNDQRAHANSHACDYDDTEHAPLVRVWEKLRDASA